MTNPSKRQIIKRKRKSEWKKGLVYEYKLVGVSIQKQVLGIALKSASTDEHKKKVSQESLTP